MSKLEIAWIRKDHITEEEWLRLYNCLVRPVLLYNCSIWRLTKKDENMLDLLHRSQLRYLISKIFLHVISNVNLYKNWKSFSISLFILKACWKLFGHVLNSDPKCSGNTAIWYYFEETDSNNYCGWLRATIFTAQDDIKRILE